MVFEPNLVPKCHLSRYLFSLSLSLSLSQKSDSSLLPLSYLFGFLFSHSLSHGRNPCFATTILHSLFESMLWRQLVFLSHGREFLFLFLGLGLCLCLGLCAKHPRNVWQRPTSFATIGGRRPFSSFFVILFYFFFISLLFWFFLVWVLVKLWIEFSYDDKDLVIFYLSLKGGVYVLSFADLWVFFDLEFVSKWV